LISRVFALWTAGFNFRLRRVLQQIAYCIVSGQ
jgi:hypothetical protein